MKIRLLFPLLILSLYTVAQIEQTQKEISAMDHGFKVEFFALPAVFFNHASVGVSYKLQSPFEHNLSLGSWYDMMYFGESFNLNLCYSVNRYLGDGGNYIPLWFRVSNTRRTIGYEDGYHPHTLRYSIGTGFGRLFEINEKWGVRAEAGIGVALNQTSTLGKVLSLNLNLSDYTYDEYYPDQNPSIIPVFKFKVSFVRAFSNNDLR